MTETSTELAGAQTQFLPQPGAGSFKRLLGCTFTGTTPLTLLGPQPHSNGALDA